MIKLGPTCAIWKALVLGAHTAADPVVLPTHPSMHRAGAQRAMRRATSCQRLLQHRRAGVTWQRRRSSSAATGAAAMAAAGDAQRVPPIPGLGAPHPHHGVVASPSEHPRAPAVELSPPLSAAVSRSSGRLPSQRYAALIEAGVLQADAAQREVIGSLDALCEQLHTHQLAMKSYVSAFTAWAELRVQAEDAERERRKHKTPTRMDLLKTRLAKFRGDDGLDEPSPEELSNEHYGLPEPPPVPTPPAGMYLYGGVGTGKSLLMDILYAATDDVVRHRRRVHFHTFLLEVHARLHVHSTARRAAATGRRTHREGGREWEVDGAAGGGTAAWEHPMAAVARELIAAPGHSLLPEDAAAGGARQVASAASGAASSKSWLPHEENALLLCFDEFQLNEVGDALIVRGLLNHLFKMGVVTVITSNRPPEEVNRNAAGWQAVDYEAFLKLLTSHTSTVKLDAGKDYRRSVSDATHRRATTACTRCNDAAADHRSIFLVLLLLLLLLPPPPLLLLLLLLLLLRLLSQPGLRCSLLPGFALVGSAWLSLDWIGLDC